MKGNTVDDVLLVAVVVARLSICRDLAWSASGYGWPVELHLGSVERMLAMVVAVVAGSRVLRDLAFGASRHGWPGELNLRAIQRMLSLVVVVAWARVLRHLSRGTGSN